MYLSNTRTDSPLFEKLFKPDVRLLLARQQDGNTEPKYRKGGHCHIVESLTLVQRNYGISRGFKVTQRSMRQVIPST